MINIKISVVKNGQVLTPPLPVQLQDGANVQMAMEAAYNGNTNPHQIGFSLKYFGSALGYLVTEIDGLSSQANLYWILYVKSSGSNWTISNLGIDHEILNDGDQVEFRYEPYSVATHGNTVYRIKHEAYLKQK